METIILIQILLSLLSSVFFLFGVRYDKEDNQNWKTSSILGFLLLILIFPPFNLFVIYMAIDTHGHRFSYALKKNVFGEIKKVADKSKKKREMKKYPALVSLEVIKELIGEYEKNARFVSNEKTAEFDNELDITPEKYLYFLSRFKKSCDFAQLNLEDPRVVNILDDYHFSFANVVASYREAKKINTTLSLEVLLASIKIVNLFNNEIEGRKRELSNLEKKTAEQIRKRMLQEIEDEHQLHQNRRDRLENM